MYATVPDLYISARAQIQVLMLVVQALSLFCSLGRTVSLYRTGCTGHLHQLSASSFLSFLSLLLPWFAHFTQADWGGSLSMVGDIF